MSMNCCLDPEHMISPSKWPELIAIILFIRHNGKGTDNKNMINFFLMTSTKFKLKFW